MRQREYFTPRPGGGGKIREDFTPFPPGRGEFTRSAGAPRLLSITEAELAPQSPRASRAYFSNWVTTPVFIFARRQHPMPKLSDSARHRTKTISFRTSEQTEYAIDLIARKHGITKTAVLQFALRHFLRDANEGLSLAEGAKVSFEQVVRETWAPDP